MRIAYDTNYGLYSRKDLLEQLEYLNKRTKEVLRDINVTYPVKDSTLMAYFSSFNLVMQNTILLLETTVQELSEILPSLNNKVAEHDIRRIRHLGDNFIELNLKI